MPDIEICKFLDELRGLVWYNYFREIFPTFATDFAAGARNIYRDVIGNITLRIEQSTNGRGFRDVCNISRANWQRAADGIVEEQSKQLSPSGILRPHESVESVSGIMAQSSGGYYYEN